MDNGFGSRISFPVLLFFSQVTNKKLIQDIYHYWNGTSAVFGKKLRKYTSVPEHADENTYFDNSFNRYLFWQHSGGLVNLLHYGDALSMANSIESRLPFMDYRLVEFVFSLPFYLKMKYGLGKYLHRKAVESFVPDYIVNNPLKFGFTTPLSMHFMTENEGSAIALLLSEKCLSRGIFSEKELRVLIEKHQSKKFNYARILFRLLSTELWFRNFIDNDMTTVNTASELNPNSIYSN